MDSDSLRSLVSQYLIHKTDFVKLKENLSEDQLRVFVDKAINHLAYEEQIEISTEQRLSLIRDFVAASMSLGPLRSLMEDKDITEIMVNGPDKVYIQRGGKIELSNIKFSSSQQLIHTVQKLLAASGSSGRVDESSPYVDFCLQNGARINAVVPPCTLKGGVITIRKFNEAISTVDNLLELKMLDKSIAVFLIAAIKAKLNIFFTGATGTGKTTALNVFSRHISEGERIITIEDTPELRLKQDHVVTLLTKPANIEGKGAITIRDLFVNSLRMRPDRVIIGEIRSSEMLDLIQSIASGHSGSLAVVHADSPEDAFNRMITMMMMAGLQMSTREIRKQVARAVDLIVHIELFKDGVRRITQIADTIYDKEKDEVYLTNIFNFIQDNIDKDGKISGHWEMDHRKPSFFAKFDKHGVKLPDGFFK
ncbi:MAG: ATPase, T2SS/T4P/T4SS family [Candidatus Omnitrophota bacterium]